MTQKHRIEQVTCVCRTRWKKELVVEWCEGCKGRGSYAVRLRDETPEVSSHMESKWRRYIDATDEQREGFKQAFNKRFMDDKVDEMTDDQYGKWIDTLPFEEFLAMIDMHGMNAAR